MKTDKEYFDPMFKDYVCDSDTETIKTVSCQDESPLQRAIRYWEDKGYIKTVTKKADFGRSNFYYYNFYLTEYGSMHFTLLQL